MKVECTICGKAFSHKFRLSEHQRVHDNLRPYPCTVENCGKEYKTTTALKDHMLGSHGGEKKFCCGNCGVQFGRITSYRKHCLDYHPEIAKT
jgi:uncharacterized Zn-finger protein